MVCGPHPLVSFYLFDRVFSVAMELPKIQNEVFYSGCVSGQENSG